MRIFLGAEIWLLSGNANIYLTSVVVSFLKPEKSQPHALIGPQGHVPFQRVVIRSGAGSLWEEGGGLLKTCLVNFLIKNLLRAKSISRKKHYFDHFSILYSQKLNFSTILHYFAVIDEPIGGVI